MAGALVSIVLEQLAFVIHKQIEAEVKLVASVGYEVQKLTSNFCAIRAVLDDAESREVKDLAVRDWIDKLIDTSYDIDDALDEWITGVEIKGIENAFKPKRKVWSFIPRYCFCFRKNVFLRHDIALKIKELNRKLDVIATEKNMLNFRLTRETIELKRPPATTSIIDVSNIHGREHDKDTLLMMLLSDNSQAPTIPVISIVGMGGIGKTTLAQLVFNDDQVNTHFDKKIWVCVSEPFDKIRIAKSILESFLGDASNLVELQIVLQEIRKFLRGKKFLLVLDDVSTENPTDWEQLRGILKCGNFQQSRILVTTRKQNIAKIIGTTDNNMILLGLLSEEESWSLFSHIAFFERTNEEREKLQDIGRRIISKCNGLPLAIKILGSLLRLKSSIKEWQSVLDNEIWRLEEVERVIFPPLLLSYYDLTFASRKCFSYCAIFPKDHEIKKDKLIKLWMAQSYLRDERGKDMELIGEEYFENLAMHSFFQDFERDEFDGSITSCKMHDMVHDFAQYIAKNECFSIEIVDFGESQAQFSFEKGRHLMVGLKHGDSFPMYIYNAKNLRSLLVGCQNLSNMAISKLFCEFACLRTLELSYCGIKLLSSEIKELIHLRYLDLSNNQELTELPETLCELCNLQTLNLNDCKGLKKLPQEMGKLINLRHLLNNMTCYNSLNEMPRGIEGLTYLRTLREFGVCRNREGSGLEYLKNLNNLRGSLDIIGLGDVGDVGEVNKAKLMNKTNLISLRFYFRKYDEGRKNRNNGIDEAIFEALQPPPNLERLEIYDYEGKALQLNSMIALNKLRFLKLDNCINLEDITISMPSLNSLEIWYCWKLKSLPDHILQTPLLKEFKIYGCPTLKKRYTGVDWIKISHIPYVNFAENMFDYES